MSTFSELNARLAQGLADAVAAIESKNGTVSMANTTPQIEEIVDGIESISTTATSSESSGINMARIMSEASRVCTYRDVTQTSEGLFNPIVHTALISSYDAVTLNESITTEIS